MGIKIFEHNSIEVDKDIFFTVEKPKPQLRIGDVLLDYHNWLNENVDYWDSSPSELHVISYLESLKNK